MGHDYTRAGNASLRLLPENEAEEGFYRRAHGSPRVLQPVGYNAHHSLPWVGSRKVDQGISIGPQGAVIGL
jgi:hypothetical protein